MLQHYPPDVEQGTTAKSRLLLAAVSYLPIEWLLRDRK